MKRSLDLSRSRMASTNHVHTRADRRRRRPQFRPLWEPVEDRTLLSTVLWTGGGADNNWANAANWVNAVDSTDHHTPTDSDDAVIDNTYTSVSGVTIVASGSNSVGSITSQAAIDITSGTLSISRASTINSGL